MKLSIVTSTYNASKEVSATIKNISLLKELSNKFNFDVEWIVIDGSSTDSTVKIVNESKTADVLISEEDNGIYDAWNKSLKIITGDWVVFLGAGDTLNLDNVPYFAERLQEIDVDIVKLAYGKVNLVDSDDNVLKVYGFFTQNRDWSNGRPPLPCHQGVFHHKSLFFELHYKFDMKYRIAGDSKFLFSVLNSFSEIAFVDKIIANMRMGGVSTEPEHILKVRKELVALRKEFDFNMPFFELIKFNLKCYLKYILVTSLPRNLFSYVSLIWSKLKDKESLY